MSTGDKLSHVLVFYLSVVGDVRCHFSIIPLEEEKPKSINRPEVQPRILDVAAQVHIWCKS